MLVRIYISQILHSRNFGIQCFRNFSNLFYHFTNLFNHFLFCFSFIQALITDTTQSADIQTSLDTNQSLLVKSPFRRADGTSFPCLLALHPVFSLLPHMGSGVGNSIELDKFDRYVRVTESMTGDSSAGKGNDFEYEYQVWLFCDTSKSEEVHYVEIAEMARLLRILPQSVLNEMLPCALSEIARLEGICNRSMLSRSFLNECEEGIDITRSMETYKNNHLESIRSKTSHPISSDLI